VVLEDPGRFDVLAGTLPEYELDRVLDHALAGLLGDFDRAILHHHRERSVAGPHLGDERRVVALQRLHRQAQAVDGLPALVAGELVADGLFDALTRPEPRRPAARQTQ